ncbi:hypothetical protein Droror1_Dr00006873 [Drosera rotundifolia]
MVRFGAECGSKSTWFRVICNGFAAVLFLCCIFNGENIVSNRFMGRTSSILVKNWAKGDGFWGFDSTPRRRLDEMDEIMMNRSLSFDGVDENGKMRLIEPKLCSKFYEEKGSRARCDYLIANPGCSMGGYLNYIKFFYCDCIKYSFLGYIVLGGWLLALFYLLGNTAADYFCCSLEKLSDLLNLSPAVAGVSLLPLGNGAPDVFAGIAAFVGTGSGEVGLNSVLGGAVFVVCVVVGVVSLSVSSKGVRIDRSCFIRDLCFFLFALICLVVITAVGKVSLGGAIAFLSTYAVYAFSVALNELWWKKGKFSGVNSSLPVARGPIPVNDEGKGSVRVPLLNGDANDDPPNAMKKLPHWIWSSNVAIYSDHMINSNVDDTDPSSWGCCCDEQKSSKCSWFSCSNLWYLTEMPLTIPRRLTIPTVEENRWSKGYAVASASLAPVLLSCLWSLQENIGSLSLKIGFSVGSTVGFMLGVLAFVYTKSAHPPRKFLFAWVFGGFFMSIVWFYVIANELVALLVSLGVILGINPSLLAVTILAWGNSMGDLMSNTALAMNQGNGVQIAMSGCYAGPMFNMLVGLGISMVLGAWSGRPEPYVVPRDSNIYYTMGFLVFGLIWALIVLPRSDMRPNKVLGVGLIVIYLVFLCLRVGAAIGMIS